MGRLLCRPWPYLFAQLLGKCTSEERKKEDKKHSFTKAAMQLYVEKISLKTLMTKNCVLDSLAANLWHHSFKKCLLTIWLWTHLDWQLFNSEKNSCCVYKRKRTFCNQAYKHWIKIFGKERQDYSYSFTGWLNNPNKIY